MKKICVLLLAAALVMISISCKKEAASPAESEAAEESETAKEPERITVQHILISFNGADPRMDVARSREEAEELAGQLLERAKGGEDFDALVKEFTDDSHPGIYTMANLEVTPDRENNEFPRAGMVKAFGDVGFGLKVGEIGMTDYDPEASKYGWHIIKRLK
jgi:parvulin-like peptidyl-prolyl isomerase